MLEVGEQDYLNGNDVEDILNYISVELILDNLNEQIENLENVESFINYINIFENKYNFILKSYESNQDIINMINEIKDDFYLKVLHNIETKFSFKLTFNSLVLKEDLYKIISIIYEFLIINIKDNLIIFFKNYIMKDSKNIIKSFKTEINQKDIYFTLLKKELNKDNAVLIYSINNLIDIIDIDFIEDFFEMIINEDPDEYVNYFINNIFIEQEFLEEIICDMNSFTNTIKDIIKNNSSIIQSTKANLYKDIITKQKLEQTNNIESE